MATYDSLCYLRDTHPECEFSWVIGTDWLQPGTNIRQWKSKGGVSGDQMLREFDFLVARRSGYDAPAELSTFGPRFKYLDMPDGFTLAESNAASTEVRKRARAAYYDELAAGGDGGSLALRAMDGLVPPTVLAYIVRHALYKDLAFKDTLRRAGRLVVHARRLLS
jgi:nicotinic acid mononucleotide adenylyltransferase